MEKVKVVKPVPGILNIGDILVSPAEGADFCLEEVDVTSLGSNERFVSLDYVTVSENVPQFFEFMIDSFELVFNDTSSYEEELVKKCSCEQCNCKEELDFTVSRTNEAILDRYEFFTQKYRESEPGSESQVVYRNLMWFIEWLIGKAEIL